MSNSTIPLAAVLGAVLLAPGAAQAQPSNAVRDTIAAATAALAPGVRGGVRTIEYVVTGDGLTPVAGDGAWSPFKITNGVLDLNYAGPRRRNIINYAYPDGRKATVINGINGKVAWLESKPGVFSSVHAATYHATGTRGIWGTPHGIVRAAAMAAERDPGSVRVGRQDGMTTLSFVWNDIPTRIFLGDDNRPAMVAVNVVHPVLGPTVQETVYSGYRRWDGGAYFPTGIVQKAGGRVIETLKVTGFKTNPTVVVTVPESLRGQCGGRSDICD